MSRCIDDCLWIKKHCNIECKFDQRCILWSISNNEAANILNNSVLEDNAVLQMDFGANKTTTKVINEFAFGGSYFRDI